MEAKSTQVCSASETFTFLTDYCTKKAILPGLEILVAGDIIATVVTEQTMDSVLALGVIVLIRTFLRLSIPVEIDGKFPWSKETPEKTKLPPDPK